MITVLLQGRTGNNLFQYAAGRYLSHARNTTLRLDASWRPSKEALQARNLTRLPLEADFVRRHPAVKRAARKLLAMGPGKFHRGNVFREPDRAPGFISTLSDLPDGTLLDGFFQCSEYASGIESQLRRELDLSTVLLPSNASRPLKDMETTSAVSVHIRRGDYLSIPGTQCIAENYYELAIAYLQSRHENLRFFIFSDDLAWCRKRFNGREFTLTSIPESLIDPLIDLRLMAACKHHIIVNSSYSWWGAWLSSSQEGTVVAPKMWMRELPSERIIHPRWVTL